MRVGKLSVLKIVLYSLFYFLSPHRYTSKEAHAFFLELLIGFEGVSWHRSWSNPEIPKLGLHLIFHLITRSLEGGVTAADQEFDALYDHVC